MMEELAMPSTTDHTITYLHWQNGPLTIIKKVITTPIFHHELNTELSLVMLLLNKLNLSTASGKLMWRRLPFNQPNLSGISFK
jgi:hypothetical protein